jgi:D-serine deaminase-like pyridoxal phosphate-dependent protein
VATIAEAEVMVRNEIRGLLITAELVGQPKLSRFVEVLKIAPETLLVVDNIEGVLQLQTVIQQAELESAVLIDLDVGQNRTGIKPGEPARDLAAAIARSPNLRLKGICAYAGHVAHAAGFETRRQKSRDAISLALETRELLQRAGHNVPILSVGSTGTYNIDSHIAGVTEIQAGSYVFMDVEYRQIGGASNNVYTDFSPALTVLATVIHRSQGRAIVDAGL